MGSLLFAVFGLTLVLQSWYMRPANVNVIGWDHCCLQSLGWPWFYKVITFGSQCDVITVVFGLALILQSSYIHTEANVIEDVM